MKYFIGIVPPEDIYKAILNIQQQFGDNRVEPHITICPPVTPLNDADWLMAVEKMTPEFAPFTIELPATGFFGNRVLFVDVKSKDIYPLQKKLSSAIKSFEPASPKAKQAFHPHLTLGRLWCGFTKSDFIQMKKLIDELLTTQTWRFEVDTIRVYNKPVDNKRWKAFKDFKLFNGSTRNI
jgi:2'-5' RNA ligase